MQPNDPSGAPLQAPTSPLPRSVAPSTGWLSLQRDLHWVSIAMRLTIGTLFLCAALVKAPLGIQGIVAYYASLLDHSLLPAFLVRLHATFILFWEFGMALWLLSGFYLKLAWKVAGLLLISLAMG